MAKKDFNDVLSSFEAVQYILFSILCPSILRQTLGSPLIDGIFLVQKMCICSCVTLSTTLLMRAVQFNARSACDTSTFTSCIYILYIYIYIGKYIYMM